MSECLCHGESFTTCASPTRRQWMIATVGASGALSLAAIVPFVSSLMPSERAKAAGAPVEVVEVASLADSLGGGIGMANRLTYPMCRDLLDDIILVTEEEIRDAMQALYFEDRMVAEGASVTGLAALATGKVRAAGPVATILTGRNLDMGLHARIMAGEDVLLGDYLLEGRRHAA